MENALNFARSPIPPLSPTPFHPRFLAELRLSRLNRSNSDHGNRFMFARNAFGSGENGSLNGFSSLPNKIFMDEIIAYLLISAASSAVPLPNRMREGSDNIFTDSSASTISMKFFAFFSLALSALISGYKAEATQRLSNIKEAPARVAGLQSHEELARKLQNKWTEMFPCIVSRTATLDVISNIMGGTRNGALHLFGYTLVNEIVAYFTKNLG